MATVRMVTSLAGRRAALREGIRLATYGMVPVGVLLSLILVVLPLLHTKIPPFSDYINHLARSYVIAIGNRDPVLAHFYAIEWRLIPNLAMDIVVPPLAQLTDIYTAGRLFLILTMALLIAGPHVIHYALFRRWSVGPLVATLFLYNGAAISGTVSYLFGVGVALLGIAAWIRLWSAPAWARGLVSTFFIIALYISHFGACGLYAITLLSIEIWRARSDIMNYRSHWRSQVAAFVLPFLVVPVLALAGPGGEDLASGVIRWAAYEKIRGFLFAIESQSVSHIPDALIGLLIIGLALWAWRRAILHLHPAGWVVIIVGFLVFLATPVEIMSAWGADVRQPLGYIFIVSGFLDWNLATLRARRLFVLTLLCLLVARIGVVEYAWRQQGFDTADMAKSFRFIIPGSKVIIGEADNKYGHWLHYLPCQVMIERSSLCSLAFSDPRQQVLIVKPPFRAIAGGYNDDPPSLSELLKPPRRSPAAPSGRIYWVNWTKNYDYLYLLSTNGDPNPLPGTLTKVFEAPHFQLYAIAK